MLQFVAGAREAVRVGLVDFYSQKCESHVLEFLAWHTLVFWILVRML